MSKKNTPALNEESAPVKTVKKEKKAACRLFGLLFLLASVVAIVLLPYVIQPTGSSVLYSAVLAMFPTNWYQATDGVLNIVYNVSIYVFAVFAALCALLSLIALFSGKRGPVKAGSILLTIGAFLYTILYTVVEFVANGKFGFDLCSLILAVVALIATIVCLKVTKPIIEVIEEEVEEEKDPSNGFHVEEYAEAYPYEGGPVAGVLMAEEVNPSFVPQEPRVTTAGYDFYNSKAFDTFIASLNDVERNDFTEIFILKIKGTMPELPDYEVGGDNKEFFRKIFIYLGQYRDRIPNALLAKMYQYSLKIS